MNRETLPGPERDTPVNLVGVEVIIRRAAAAAGCNLRLFTEALFGVCRSKQLFLRSSVALCLQLGAGATALPIAFEAAVAKKAAAKAPTRAGIK